MHKPIMTLALAALALAGCASAPFETEDVALEVTPADVRADAAAASDRLVLWGGEIAGARNLEERTRLEVVAYPLSGRTQRPRLEAGTQGRFRVYVDGYLETARFEPGREITVRGRVDATEGGQIGAADYVFPVLRSQDFKLWPPRAAERRGDGVQFRFGIILSN